MDGKEVAYISHRSESAISGPNVETKNQMRNPGGKETALDRNGPDAAILMAQSS